MVVQSMLCLSEGGGECMYRGTWSYPLYFFYLEKGYYGICKEGRDGGMESNCHYSLFLAAVLETWEEWWVGFSRFRSWGCASGGT